MKINLLFDNQPVELDAARRGDELHVTVDGRTLVARILEQDGPLLTLEIAGRRRQIIAHVDGEQRQLWLEGGRTLTYRRPAGQAAGAAAGDAAALSTTIPAVVSQILVEVGDEVAEGDKLILLESMKMVIPITAPHAGTVTAVHCTPGEAVQPGIPLIDIT